MKTRPVAVSAISLFVALMCAGLETSGQENKPNALIVGIDGDWEMDSDAYVDADSAAKSPAGSPKEAQPTPLKFLQPIKVREGTCAYGTGGHIAIQIQTAKTVSCIVCKEGDNQSCSGHVISIRNKPVICSRQIAAQPEAGRRIVDFLASIMPSFHLGAPERYVTPVSRGLEAELSDAVVRVQSSTIDLAPAFSEMDSGSYKVRVEALDGPGKSIASTNVNWKEGGKAEVANAVLKPGLFRVVLLQTNGDAGQDAWVLATPPERFEKQSSQFREAVEITKTWPAEVDARAPRAVLRAYLDAMSRAPD
jgi:hypothetical protein